MSFPPWAIGVILITFGSLGNNFGNNLVSMGHSEKDDKKKTEDIEMSKNELEGSQVAPDGSPSDTFDCEANKQNDSTTEVATSPIPPKSSWTYRNVGVFIFVAGNLLTFASFGFGAQSLLASLESIQFVSNLVFAKYCHNEKVTIRMQLATLFIVVGNIMVVIFATHKADLLDSTQMIHLYKVNYAYQGYLVAAFLVWALMTYVYNKYHHARLKDKKLLWKHSFVEPFCYAVSSAVVGTQAVLNSKCMSMLLQVTFRGIKNEFLFWWLYFICITWIMMVAFWLYRLDLGLALFPPLFIIPVMQVFFVFFAILCGGIYFEEFLLFTTSQYIGFIFGVLLILSGVYGLAPPNMILKVPGEEASADALLVETTAQAAATTHGPDEEKLLFQMTSEDLDKQSTTNETNQQVSDELDARIKEIVHIKYAPVRRDQESSAEVAIGIDTEGSPEPQIGGQGEEVCFDEDKKRRALLDHYRGLNKSQEMSS